MIDICITNLGKYNEGTLDYERVTLPTSPEVIAAALEKIGIDNVEYEEWFLSDWESEISCVHKLVGEYSNLEELNYFADLLEELKDNGELEAFDFVADMEVSTISEAINLTQCLDDFSVNTEVTSYTELGYYMVEDLQGIDLDKLMGEDMSRYFDHEAYGRDLDLNGDVTLVEGEGMYFSANIEDSFYTGLDDIPDEHLLFNTVGSKSIEYLKNTELGTEENYNNIDGVSNNIAPKKDEKPSVIGGLKEGKETAARHEGAAKEHAPNKNDDIER